MPHPAAQLGNHRPQRRGQQRSHRQVEPPRSHRIREESPQRDADRRPAQSAYVVADHLAHADPLVERFEQWARGRLDEGFSLDDAARAVGTSKRTLARRMRPVLDKSPLSYFQDLRVERAVHLLRTTHRSLDQIAAAVGYADGVTLRTLLRRRIGRSAREIRTSG